jgi:hypothetical protein
MIRYWLHRFALIVMACVGEPMPSDDWEEITKEEYERRLDDET